MWLFEIFQLWDANSSEIVTHSDVKPSFSIRTSYLKRICSTRGFVTIPLSTENTLTFGQTSKRLITCNPSLWLHFHSLKGVVHWNGLQSPIVLQKLSVLNLYAFYYTYPLSRCIAKAKTYMPVSEMPTCSVVFIFHDECLSVLLRFVPLSKNFNTKGRKW